MILKFSTTEIIRLDEFLRREIPSAVKNGQDGNFSNSKIRRLILAGTVFVNGKQIRRPAFELRGKSFVQVEYDKEKFFYEKQPDDIKFELTEKNVLFEDEYIICVNKPALFPTEETVVGGAKRDNLHDALVRYLWKKNPELRNPPYVGIMHRLDRETSGVILFTKQRSVNKDIQKMFSEHDFVKIYLALCKKSEMQNEPQKKFCVEMFMNRISPKSQAAKWGFVPEQKGGLYSKTEFTVLCEKKINGTKCLLVQANLFTGRTHQIRVHLSSKGIPIVGDVLYGGIMSERIMLHAQKLIFTHPVTKQKLFIEAECDFFAD